MRSTENYHEMAGATVKSLSDVLSEEMIEYLISNKEAYFKSQQRDEEDLTDEQKRNIALEIFNQSKALFLSRFGKQLKEEHLKYFETFTEDENEGYDLQFYIQNLRRYFSKTKRKTDIKNRRYGALNKLICDDSYFSETEMMRRNPLLYEQLVGQYMSEEEKKKRDNIDTANITLIGVLMEGIDREATREKKREQREYEDSVMEEEDEEDDQEMKEEEDEEKVDKVTKWGEFEPTPSGFRPKTPELKDVYINSTERKILKDEFYSIMYQNFIDGKDADFDYASIDNNEEYDNIELKNCDAEEKYFDSESPEEAPNETTKTDDSEDELDVFMHRLGQHHTLKDLAADMDNL